MRNIRLLSFAIFLLSALALRAQSDFMTGVSSVSIEPDSSIFSVALSGYGYPPEGRFSIGWKCIGTTVQVTAITGMDGILYAADDNNKLWSGIPEGSSIHWKSIGNAEGIIAIAGMKGKLYAINNKGSLLVRKATQKQADWRKTGIAGNIKTLVAVQAKLYATNNQNELLSLDPARHDSQWLKIGNAENNIQSITSQGDRLYAINGSDTLWEAQPFKPGVSWAELGRYNGVTYTIRIKQVAVLNNRLYAVSRDNKLYIAYHNSDNDLSATAFAIKNKDKTVVLVGVDLTGFDYSLTDEVKEIIYQKRHIPKSAVLINASHTHFSPTAQAYPAWRDFLDHPDSLYLKNRLIKGLVQAIENAVDSLSPSDLYFGKGATNIGHNRSSANKETPHDETLDILEAKDSQGQIKGILFLTACHAVFKNDGRERFTISANFPGTARKLIRERTGSQAIFIQGCAGDINPRDSVHEKTGKELADDVMNVLHSHMTKIGGDISFSIDSLHIPVQPWSVDVIRKFKEDNRNKNDDLEAVRNVRWADLMLNRYQNNQVLDYLPEYIQTINIGNWKLVGLSREVVNEYGPAIRKIWPDKMVSVAGYCNDVASYLPKEWHVVMETYEGYGSFLWYGQPGMPPINIFDQVMDKIKTIKQE